jgi:hypothetical protein
VESLLACADDSEKFLKTPPFELMHEELAEIGKDENSNEYASIKGWEFCAGVCSPSGLHGQARQSQLTCNGGNNLVKKG